MGRPPYVYYPPTPLLPIPPCPTLPALVLALFAHPHRYDQIKRLLRDLAVHTSTQRPLYLRFKVPSGQFVAQYAGNALGLDIHVDDKTGKCVVRGVRDGGPSQACPAIKAGLVVKSVNGELLEGRTIEEITALIVAAFGEVDHGPIAVRFSDADRARRRGGGGGEGSAAALRRRERSPQRRVKTADAAVLHSLELATRDEGWVGVGECRWASLLAGVLPRVDASMASTSVAGASASASAAGGLSLPVLPAGMPASRGLLRIILHGAKNVVRKHSKDSKDTFVIMQCDRQVRHSLVAACVLWSNAFALRLFAHLRRCPCSRTTFINTGPYPRSCAAR